MMPPEQNKQAIQRMTDAFNSGDMTVVDELIAGDQYTDHTPFPGTERDPGGLKNQISHLRGAFPDVKFSIELMTAEGETVAFRWKMVGTHRGRFLGQGATNKHIEHHGNDFVTFKDGKMVDHYSADNLGELFRKLDLPYRPPGRPV